MKNKTFIVSIGISIISIISILCSCVGMEVKPDGQVAATIVLDTYCTYAKNPSDVRQESRSYEQKFEEYLKKAIVKTNPKISVIPTEDFRKAIFNGKSFEDTPRSYENLLSLTYDEEALQKLEEAKTIFIVVLNVRRTLKEEMGDCMVHEVGFILGKHRTLTITIAAHIIDVKNPEKPGRCISSEDGTSAHGVFVIIILPIPYGWYPFFMDGMAFNDAGEQIARFIEERMGLEPVAPVVVKESDLDEY